MLKLKVGGDIVEYEVDYRLFLLADCERNRTKTERKD